MVPAHLAETLGQRLELSLGRHPQRGMGLARRPEVRLHSKVQLLGPALEPDAAPPAQRLGLLDLRQTQQAAVERARLILRAGRACQLDVVELEDR